MQSLPRFPFPTDHILRLSPELSAARAGGAPVRVQLDYGAPAWLVTRYEDARRVLASPAFGRDHERAGIPAADIARMSPVDPVAESILTVDPPDHTRQRRFVYRTFTPRRVEGLREGTQKIANRLVDSMIEAGPPADLVESFGMSLPIEVICDLLGVPLSDRPRFTRWTDDQLSTTGSSAEQIGASRAAMNAYLADLAAQRRAQPTDDLIGALVQENIDGDRVSDDELNNLLRALLIGGHETTASQIPNFVFLLLASGDYERLTTDPGLVPTTVEELLRYVPLTPTGALPRFVLEDIEVGGVQLHPGDQVIVELAAANRDPSVFSDPEAPDLARTDNPHVGFGHGLHRCLGAALARMELQVALTTLATRLPALRLAVPPNEVTWHLNRFVNRPQELPVIW